jgi:hypothetical protein
MGQEDSRIIYRRTEEFRTMGGLIMERRTAAYWTGE